MQSRKGNINPDTLSFRRLQMYSVSLRNFWELQRLSELDTLELQNLDQEGVQCLSKLQHLKNLTVTHPMGMPLKALESLNTLEQLYFLRWRNVCPGKDVVFISGDHSIIAAI